MKATVGISGYKINARGTLKSINNVQAVRITRQHTNVQQHTER